MKNPGDETRKYLSILSPFLKGDLRSYDDKELANVLDFEATPNHYSQFNKNHLYSVKIDKVITTTDTANFSEKLNAYHKYVISTQNANKQLLNDYRSYIFYLYLKCFHDIYTQNYTIIPRNTVINFNNNNDGDFINMALEVFRYTSGNSLIKGGNNYLLWAKNKTDEICTLYLRPAKSRLYGDLYLDPLELDNDYLQTDDIFEMCVKSMISKIFTVVGTYSLYQRPSKDFKTNKSLVNQPLRQIMGGSAVKIIPEATELYIRLTLLGEWYRDLFNFKTDTTSDKILVSMIPSFDGVWYDFVKVIFVDASNVNDGGYTTSFSEDIVRSINTIYTHYKPKYGADICSKILENFVAEVNLRYGLVKRDEINKYIESMDEGLKEETYNVEDNVDYDILDSNDQFRRKPAPSDKFRKESYKSASNTTIKSKILIDSIKKFRENVEENLKFNDDTPENFGMLGIKHASVDDLVSQTKKRINDANTDEKKYSIIQSTILGVEQHSTVDYDTMIMFHETVINPLTILYTIYKMLNYFNRFANSMNLGEEQKFNQASVVKVLAELKGDKKYRGLADSKLYFKKTYLYFGENDYKRYYNDGHSFYRYNADDDKDTDRLSPATLMEDTINHLFYLTCDKNQLVEMYFSGTGKKSYPMLNFKKLETHVTELINLVSESLTKMRKFIPNDIIAKYEKNTQTDRIMVGVEPENVNVVSLFYLKEHLVDRLIKNKYSGGLSDANAGLKNIWRFITNLPNPDRNLSRKIRQMIYWDLNDKIYMFNPRKITNMEWSKFPINVIGITKQSALTTERVPNEVAKALMKNDFAEIKGNPSEIFRGVGSVGIYGFEGVYDYDENEVSTSTVYDKGYTKEPISPGVYGLIFKFNRLLFHYINMFTDRTSNKIYLNLLEKFANGINSFEIMKGNAIDDISIITKGDNVTPVFIVSEINPKSVIFATMARAIRNIVTDKKTISTATIMSLAETNLMSVPEYIKDLMRAYLPIFDKQLNIIYNKAELIKSLIENTNIDVSGSIPGGISDAVQDPQKVELDGIALSLKESIDGNNTKSKDHLVIMLASIEASARSLQQCITGVYKELSDIPLYFETYQNSITDYKNRNNQLPFMPLSHVSHLLNNQHRLVDGADSFTISKTEITGGAGNDMQYYTYKGLIPHKNNSVGSDEFKFAYGTRGLLSDNHEPNIEHAPGVLDILNRYNSKASSASYDKRKYTDLFTSSVHLLRYATDYIYHKTYLGDNNLDKLTEFFIVGSEHNKIEVSHQNILQHLACQTGRCGLKKHNLRNGVLKSNDDFFINTNNITLLIENDNHKQSLYKMIDCIMNKNPKFDHNDRKALRLYNILDSNIVPINFHSLQREIPLVNIFNYSYTFDHMIKQFIGVQVKNLPTDKFLYSEFPTSSDLSNIDKKYYYPEDTLVRILLQPRGVRYVRDYIHGINKLMVGDDSISLNRPKYLSDQLWNKVLLQSSVHKYTTGNDTPDVVWDSSSDPIMKQLNNANRNSLVDDVISKRNEPFFSEPLDYIANVSLKKELTYMKNYPKSDKNLIGVHFHPNNNIKLIDLGSDDKLKIYQKIGYDRYHTMIVRYIEWFIHLQRVSRLLMREQLSWVEDPIVHKSNALNEKVTDYEGNRKFELDDFE